MYDIYGAPGFLAAYNAGPGRLDDLSDAQPDACRWKRRRYVASIGPRISTAIEPHRSRRRGQMYAMNSRCRSNIPAGPRYPSTWGRNIASAAPLPTASKPIVLVAADSGVTARVRSRRSRWPRRHAGRSSELSPQPEPEPIAGGRRGAIGLVHHAQPRSRSSRSRLPRLAPTYARFDAGADFRIAVPVADGDRAGADPVSIAAQRRRRLKRRSSMPASEPDGASGWLQCRSPSRRHHRRSRASVAVRAPCSPAGRQSRPIEVAELPRAAAGSRPVCRRGGVGHLSLPAPPWVQLHPDRKWPLRSTRAPARSPR